MVNFNKIIDTLVLPWRVYVVEFLATFIFVFFALGVNLVDVLSENLGILAISFTTGIAYTGLLWATNHLAGGYMNPVVVIALWFAKKLSWEKAIIFPILQILAGFLAAVSLYYVFGQEAIEFNYGLGSILENNIQQALVLEFVFSAVFVFAVFSTMIDRGGPVSFGPLVLGFLVASFTLLLIPFSGASLNPAKVLGAAVLSNSLPVLVVGVVGPLAASLTAFLYDFLFFRKTPKA